MLDADSDDVHDVSSTKQNVNSTTDLVALAVNTSTRRYWHAHLPISPASPATQPTADFSATPTTGTAPLAVRFADSSAGSPSSWSWSFGDGGTSPQQSPMHTYASPGTYTVSLTVTNAIGSDTETKIDHVTVNPPAPDFFLAVSPTSNSVVRGSATNYAVTISPANGFSGPVALSVRGLPAGVTGSFTVNPVNVSAKTFTVDITKPTVTVTAPLGGSTVSGVTVLEATASDLTGVTGVKWYVDGVEVVSDYDGAPWTRSWSTTAVLNGTHKLYAKARDAAGNWGSSRTISFTVSNP